MYVYIYIKTKNTYVKINQYTVSNYECMHGRNIYMQGKAYYYN